MSSLRVPAENIRGYTDDTDIMDYLVGLTSDFRLLWEVYR